MALKDLTFSDLEIFVVLGEVRSVRAVARERRLSPSQVSKILKRIEVSVGAVLFKRTALGISLTPEGIEFRQNAQAILGQLPALVPNRLGSRKARVKTVTIGTTSLLNAHLLPRVLARVSRNEPNVQFRILDMPPDQIVHMGLKGVIDIAVHWDRIKWTSLWDSRDVGEIRFGLFGRKGHPLGARATADQVRPFPFLLPIYLQQSSVRYGDDRCPLKRELRIAGDQTSTASTAVKIAEDSDQLMFVPTCVADGAELVEIQVEEWKSVRQKIYLSLNSQNVHRRLADLLMESLKEAAP